MNILRYALKNIFRNLFLSFSSILTIGLLVFLVNILLLVVHISDDFIVSINNKIAIVLNFREWYNNSQIRSQDFLSGAISQFPEISVKYVSREEALWVLEKRHSDLMAIIEDAEENPLPNSVIISQIPLKDYQKIDTFVSGFKDILQYDEENMTQKLVDYQSQFERISKVIHLMTLVKNAIFILIWLFLFVMFVVIHTVIRNFIFFLQDEVRIIELVGGKPSFIYGPFMIQGVLYTFIATLGAFIVFVLFNWFWVEYLPENFAKVYENFFIMLSGRYFFIEIVVAVIIGIFSAFLASYKYIYSTIRE